MLCISHQLALIIHHLPHDTLGCDMDAFKIHVHRHSWVVVVERCDLTPCQGALSLPASDSAQPLLVPLFLLQLERVSLPALSVVNPLAIHFTGTWPEPPYVKRHGRIIVRLLSQILIHAFESRKREEVDPHVPTPPPEIVLLFHGPSLWI